MASRRIWEVKARIVRILWRTIVLGIVEIIKIGRIIIIIILRKARNLFKIRAKRKISRINKYWKRKAKISWLSCERKRKRVFWERIKGKNIKRVKRNFEKRVWRVAWKITVRIKRITIINIDADIRTRKT